jgi:hypothetical protein
MIVSRPRPSPPSSAFYFIPFCTNTSILSVEKLSTQYAISLTIPWVAGDPGMPCKLNLLPCARAQTPAPANAHFASFLDVPTLSWIFRQMQSFGCSKTVCRIDRVSKFVPPHLPSLTPISYGYRSGTQHFALLCPISPLPINTKSHSPYPSCTPCWTRSRLSPTHICPSSSSPSPLSRPPIPNYSSPTSKFYSLSSPP